MSHAEFKREDRYLVLKFKDLAGVDARLITQLTDVLAKISEDLPEREYLVIESDWPEYGPTWKAIEERMNETR